MSDLIQTYSDIHTIGKHCIQNFGENIEPFTEVLSGFYHLKLDLLIKVNNTKLVHNIQCVQDKIRSIEPNQYYYPSNNLVIVFENILGFCCNTYYESQVMLYDKALSECFKGLGKFTIRLKGLITSDSAIILKGYIHEGILNVQSKIKKHFKKNNIFYCEGLKSGGCPLQIVKYIQPLKNRERLIRLIDHANNLYVGTETVYEIILVAHDAFSHNKIVLKTYKLL